MGKAVEQVAMTRGHTVHIVHEFEPTSPLSDDIAAVIEFTQAQVAPDIIRRSIDAGKVVVSGTTGWDDEQERVFAYCREKGGTMLWAPNFSIGMHIMYTINKALAQMMDARIEYDVEILETHHTEKKDEPSGTAISLANQIISSVSRKTHWQLTDQGQVAADTLAITAERKPDVKGIHRVTYKSPYDVVSLRHRALSREAFAFGAVISAEWLAPAGIKRKTGVYTFSDVINTAISL